MSFLTGCLVSPDGTLALPAPPPPVTGGGGGGGAAGDIVSCGSEVLGFANAQIVKLCATDPQAIGLAVAAAQLDHPAQTWGHARVTSATPFTSPTGLLSLDVVGILGTSSTVTVNGQAIAFQAGQSGSWSEIPNATHGPGYVTITCAVGSEAYVTYQKL
jgi:hypothetical protein